jgi:hypothetical protein
MLIGEVNHNPKHKSQSFERLLEMFVPLAKIGACRMWGRKAGDHPSSQSAGQDNYVSLIR